MENEKKVEKKCLFSFAKINKYFIFPFLCPIFCVIANYFIFLILKKENIKHKEFILSNAVCATYIGGGLLYFISSIGTKTEEKRNEEVENKQKERSPSSITYIFNDGLRKQNKSKIFGILIIMSIIIVLVEICALYSFDNNVFEQRLYILFSIALFSKIILKDNIFKHQILSLFISFIGLILLFFPVLFVIKTNDILANIFLFLTSVPYGLFFVLIKDLTQHYYILPYLLLLYVGFFAIVMLFVGYAIYSLITRKDFSFIIECFDFSEVENGLKLFFYFLGTFIFGSLLQAFSVLVIFYFSPTLLMVTDIISPMITWIIHSIEESQEIKTTIFRIFGYFVVLIGSLIYNEIVICNFCGFNTYTKKYLDKRQNEESTLLRKTEFEIKNKELNQTQSDNESVDSDNEDGKSN
jgi:hypothetical protein